MRTGYPTNRDEIETQARFSIAEWTDRGSDMSPAEFRRCVATVLRHSDYEAAMIVNSSPNEQVDWLPGDLIPHGCGHLRMVRIIEETRAMVAAISQPPDVKDSDA